MIPSVDTSLVYTLLKLSNVHPKQRPGEFDGLYKEWRRAYKRVWKRNQRRDPVRGEKLREYERQYLRDRKVSDPEFVDRKRRQKESSDQRLSASPEWRKARSRQVVRRKFQMERGAYEAMLAKQGGVCAICLQPEIVTYRGAPRSLAVDHCHETGRIRGLLCNSCNRGVGDFGDNPARLRAAADYLDRA